MVKIESAVVEQAIIKEIAKLKRLSTVDKNANIDPDCKPGLIGVRSQILVDVMGVLEEMLEITIPNNCYIFRDADGIKEYSIREAAQKLIKRAQYAK